MPSDPIYPVTVRNPDGTIKKVISSKELRRREVQKIEKTIEPDVRDRVKDLQGWLKDQELQAWLKDSRLADQFGRDHGSDLDRGRSEFSEFNNIFDSYPVEENELWNPRWNEME